MQNALNASGNGLFGLVSIDAFPPGNPFHEVGHQQTCFTINLLRVFKLFFKTAEFFRRLRVIGKRGRAGWLVIQATPGAFFGFGQINVDILALVPQCLQFFFRGDFKTLKLESRFQPRSVQLGDEHTNGKLLDGCVNSDPPFICFDLCCGFFLLAKGPPISENHHFLSRQTNICPREVNNKPNRSLQCSLIPSLFIPERWSLFIKIANSSCLP